MRVRWESSALPWIGGGLLVLIVAATLLAPWITRYAPHEQIDPAQNRFQKPSGMHWFGTDGFGRDVFSRVLHGGRISLLIALCVVMGSLLLGTVYGAVSGYAGGWMDLVMMRLVDLFLSFPLVFLAVTCMALFGSGIWMLILVLSLTGWMDIARLVRAEVETLKTRPFLLRAHASGLRTSHVVMRHLLPNVAVTIVAFAVIRLADILLIESALSFIGLGVQPPTASWGSIIRDGKSVLGSAWWLTLFPGVAILLTTMSLNFIGASIRRMRV